MSEEYNNLISELLQILHTGIALMSPTGHFLFCNKAFIEMFNLPDNIIGKHITDFFITGELGVMSTIRTRKLVVCSSLTTTNAKGISFRYPIIGKDNELKAVVVESISANIGKDKLLALMDTVKNIETQVNHFEENRAKKTSMLHRFENIIGESLAIEQMRCFGRRFAISNEPILITGESGTGKELVAQALHMSSMRADKPFVAVNCSALPHDLMEAEMFGYASGAFTGAKAGGIKGKFEMADTGTIFLDEIGEMPLPLQAKLLRALESGEIQKIAHTGKPIVLNFRVIAATNRDLAAMVQEGSFREDLYHRLNIFELHIPSLRERKNDIPLLTKYFIGRSVGEKRAKEIQVDPELFKIFTQYSWKGNVRELKNVLTYALYALGEDDSLLSIKHLPARMLNTLTPDSSTSTKIPDYTPADTSARKHEHQESTQPQNNLAQVNAVAEREAIMKALVASRYNKTLTAEMLQVSRSKLYRKMKEYNL